MAIYSLRILHCWGHFAGTVCRVTTWEAKPRSSSSSLTGENTNTKAIPGCCLSGILSSNEEGKHCVEKHTRETGISREIGDAGQLQ